VKKPISALLILTLALSMFITPAYASDLLEGPLNNSVSLFPQDGDSFSAPSFIFWECYGTVANSPAQNIASLGTKSNSITGVRLELYTVPKPGTLGGSITHYCTLFSATCASKTRSVTLSESDTISLPAGYYRLSLYADYRGYTYEDDYLIASSDFSVYENSSSSSQNQPPVAPPPADTTPQTSTITIYYELMDGTILETEERVCEVGYQDIYPGWSYASYELISDSYVTINISPYGNNIARFIYLPSCEYNTPPEESYSGMYDMGIPQIYPSSYGNSSQNMYVYWVQMQMKATGQYYQGGEWDETGYLGDHTQSEIKRMMRNNGYSNHSGCVDQDVVNVLASILGARIQPIYVGDFYDRMHILTSGSTFGSMKRVQDVNGQYTVQAEWVQRCLKKLGYYTGPIDGEFGNMTISAVKAFQRDHGFQQRPYVTLGVARTMLEECYYRGFDLSDLP